jgi:hypothetical protein
MVNKKSFLSSKYFYECHKKEISKYISEKKEYLTIFNDNSNVEKDLFEELLIVSSEKSIEDAIVSYSSDKKYDLIVLTDIFELSEDIYSSLKSLRKFLKEDGLVVLSSINPAWHFLINIFEKIGLKTSSNILSYIKPSKIENILKAANYQKIKNYNRVFVPFKLFGLGKIINYMMYIFFPFLNFGIRNYLMYKNSNLTKNNFSKSIIVPAKNEEGNLKELIERIPRFKEPYEIIIICGESKDNTYKKAIEIQNIFKEFDIKVMKQTKDGKANAIWEGLDASTNEVLAILDSDLSVDPEKLTDFFEIVDNGTADFVNGTRLIYKMEKGSMQLLNKIGNRFFQFIISKLISIKLTDSLCGTKVFKKENIQIIKKWQSRMHFQDPFCDFDLIFSSAYVAQKIVELPVHYRARKYGTTNISRFRDGRKLFSYFINSYFLFKTDYSKSNKELIQ